MLVVAEKLDRPWRARQYNPSTGRWLSQDPIGFSSEDINYYRYVGNRPIENIDALGLKIYDVTNGAIPSKLTQTPLWQELDGMPDTIVIQINNNLSYNGNPVEGLTSVKNGYILVEINPSTQNSQDFYNDISDTVIHELNHARLNILAPGETNEDIDTNVFLPGELQRNIGVCYQRGY